MRAVIATEVDGVQAVPVVAAYHAREGFARRYMDVPEDPALADFEASGDRFPVFRLDDAASG